KAFLVVGVLILLLIPSFAMVSAEEISSTGNKTYGSRATNGYHNFSETIHILTQLEKTYPNIVKMYDLSQRYSYFNGTPKTTVYGNRLYAIKISDNPSLEESGEPAVLYVGTHHAREWITTETCIYIAKYLAQNYNTNTTVKKMVDSNEIWVLPVHNPDGFIYSHSRDDINRSSGSGGWRKNRQETNGMPGFQNNGGSLGDGVDLNRNYGYQWGCDNVGSSGDPNYTTYRGKSAFSEVETQIMRDFALDRQFKTAISFHSHGQIIIFPWAYADLDTDHHPLFIEMAKEMSIYNGYAYGNAKSGIIYNCNGEFTDWMYNSIGTLAFTYELATAFIPPPAQVPNICKKNAEAAFVAAKYADDPFALLESGLEGVVRDTKGNPLEGVELKTKFINDTITASTDENGKYTMKLPGTTYTVTAEKDGYESVEIENVVVPQASKKTLNLVLRDIVPPEVSEVKAVKVISSEEGRTVFNASEDVIFIVKDSDNETDLTGYVIVNSTSQNYLSEKLSLTYSLGLQAYYVHWQTLGLDQSDDYRVDAVLTDYDGNSDLNGSNELGPDLVITLLDVTAPEIYDVRSRVGTDTDGIYEKGSTVLIEIHEAFQEINLTGTVDITEKSLDYSTGYQPVLYSQEYNYYYYEWDTTGLTPSSAYQVRTTLKDKWGNTDNDGLGKGVDITIKIVDTKAPLIYSIESQVGEDTDGDYDLGSSVKILVYEYYNESGLNGYIEINSPDLTKDYSEVLPLSFDSDNNVYYTYWDTTNATPFIDYYVDSVLTDDYNNSDSDGVITFGPVLVITLNDFVAPTINNVYAVKNDEFTNKNDTVSAEPSLNFELGDSVRIIVEPAKFELDLKGMVYISSSKSGYELTTFMIQFDDVYNHYYIIWETESLIPADDYYVDTILMDKYGNTDTDGLLPTEPDLVLSLQDTTPPVVIKISVTYPDLPKYELERVELGKTVNIDIRVENNEKNLIGKIKLTSKTNSYDSGEITAEYSETSRLYTCKWITKDLSPGDDYELEAIFCDIYNNFDIDGLKSGPDVKLILEDTMEPETINDLKGSEDPNKKGVVALSWSEVEPNTTVKIYRSETEITSLDDAELIKTIPPGTTTYRDEVGADGLTYHYVVIIVDEHGNENSTINPGNTVTVTVTEVEEKGADAQSKSLNLVILALIILIVVIISFLYLRRRKAKKHAEEAMETSGETPEALPPADSQTPLPQTPTPVPLEGQIQPLPELQTPTVVPEYAQLPPVSTTPEVVAVEAGVVPVPADEPIPVLIPDVPKCPQCGSQLPQGGTACIYCNPPAESSLI
ncbi:MAG: carboxypeptidase regulatory-like domain-containing protein, partial [Thermoplasmata archaeon]